MSMNERAIRAYSILAKGDKPQVLDTENWLVKSQSGNGKYRVTRHGADWTCECPDHTKRKLNCKHILTVMFWTGIKNKRMTKFTIPEIENKFCPFCHSDNLTKWGIRKNKGEPKQRYSCGKCGKKFVAEICVKFKGTDKTITAVMDMWYKGMSVRQIQDHLKQFYGFKVHYSTIYRWIVRFSDKINKYVSQLKPEVSDVWHADEQFVKARTPRIGGLENQAICWNILDSKTRFLIESNLTELREQYDARQTFIRAKAIAGEPKVVITDSLKAYEDVIKTELPNAEHHRYKSFMSHRQNNKIERFHNTFRARDKTMRGLKSVKTAHEYAKSFQTYYNFIRPHSALNGLTPAQMAGLNLGLEGNRWLCLLKK